MSRILLYLLIHFFLTAQATQVLFGVVHDDPSSFLATQVELGITAAFTEFNSLASAPCSRSLQLQPSSPSSGNAAAQVTALVSSGVVGFVGCTGDQAIEATAAVAQSSGIPFVGPVSGHSALRQPFVPNVLPIRGSQSDEGLALVQQLREGQGLQLFVLIYEQGYADLPAVEAISQACSSTGLELLSAAGYNSSNFTSDVVGVNLTLGSVLVQCSPFVPEAILVIAREGIAAEVILASRKVPSLSGSMFGILSVADTDGFTTLVGSDTTGLLFSQVSLLREIFSLEYLFTASSHVLFCIFSALAVCFRSTFHALMDRIFPPHIDRTFVSLKPLV